MCDEAISSSEGREIASLRYSGTWRSVIATLSLRRGSDLSPVLRLLRKLRSQ